MLYAYIGCTFIYVLTKCVQMEKHTYTDTHFYVTFPIIIFVTILVSTCDGNDPPLNPHLGEESCLLIYFETHHEVRGHKTLAPPPPSGLHK